MGAPGLSFPPRVPANRFAVRGIKAVGGRPEKSRSDFGVFVCQSGPSPPGAYRRPHRVGRKPPRKKLELRHSTFTVKAGDVSDKITVKITKINGRGAAAAGALDSGRVVRPNKLMAFTFSEGGKSARMEARLFAPTKRAAGLPAAKARGALRL
jgi:hypothetical protein